MIARTLALVLTLALLAGCGFGDGEDGREAAVLSVARDYADALADLDLGAVEELSTPDGLAREIADADARAALPDAIEAIENPTVSIIGPETFDEDEPAYDYRVSLSYTLDGHPGGLLLTVSREPDSDPEDSDDWRVLVEVPHSEPVNLNEAARDARIGDVDVSISEGSGISAYPGVYRLEPADGDGETTDIVVGADPAVTLTPTG